MSPMSVTVRLSCCANKVCGLPVSAIQTNKASLYLLKAKSTHGAYCQRFCLSLSNDSSLKSCTSSFASHSAIFKINRGSSIFQFTCSGFLKENSYLKFNLIQRQFYSSTMEKYLIDTYFVNGEWKKSKSTFPVYNPFTNKVLCDAANCTKDDALDAINHAKFAFKHWSKTTGKVGRLLRLVCIWYQVW